jgi:hypothetical protein
VGKGEEDFKYLDMLPVPYTRADGRRQIATKRLGCEEKYREAQLSKTAVTARRKEFKITHRDRLL